MEVSQNSRKWEAGKRKALMERVKGAPETQRPEGSEGGVARARRESMPGNAPCDNNTLWAMGCSLQIFLQTLTKWLWLWWFKKEQAGPALPPGKHDHGGATVAGEQGRGAPRMGQRLGGCRAAGQPRLGILRDTGLPSRCEVGRGVRHSAGRG